MCEYGRMFRCTWRWLGVNYSPRDKQRPMMKKVFLKNLFMAFAMVATLYKISRKYLDMYICFLSSFFISLCRNYLFASFILFFFHSLTIVLLRYFMCKVEESFYFYLILFNLRIIIPQKYSFLAFFFYLLSSRIFIFCLYKYQIACTNNTFSNNRYTYCLSANRIIYSCISQICESTKENLYISLV